MYGQPAPPRPFTVDVGGVRLTPGGFFDLIGMARSATTADPIYTHFGSIPLEETPAEALLSPAHSRVQLRGDATEGPLHFTGYVESDFLNPTRGETPYRWRQAWGAGRWGGWAVLGGKAWSLLRPNRAGVSSDVGMMNTLVVEPAYHVGLVGARGRQFRLSRAMGDYHAVFAWETAGNFVAKATVDKRFGHAELAGFTGRRGERGVSAAGVISVAGPVRWVSQHYWSRRAAAQALGVVPRGLSGGSVLEGIEISVTRRVELYGYAGWVWAGKSSGNHLVWEYTAGGSYRIPAESMHGAFLLGVQASRIDRELWTGQSGAMNYLISTFRFTFN